MPVPKTTMFGRRGAAIVGAILGFTILSKLHSTESSGETLPVIGYMANKADNLDRLSVFRQGLAELGYVEGKNIAIEFRLADVDSDYTSRASELVALRVNVILAGGAPAAVAAFRATRAIPIVLAQVNDPVGLGVINNLEHPDTNVTGTANFSSQWIGERLRLLKSFVSTLDKVAMILNGNNANNQLQFLLLKSEAEAVGIQVASLDVHSPSDVRPVFERALEFGAKGLLFGADSFINSQRSPIVDLVAQNNLPAIYNDREWVVAGGLMSVGPNRLEGYRGAAIYVDLILRGASPSDLPVAVPPPSFSVSRSALTKFGLKLPGNVSGRVNEWLD
jgi:putative ABC transport system substrate-binding protein